VFPHDDIIFDRSGPAFARCELCSPRRVLVIGNTHNHVAPAKDCHVVGNSESTAAWKLQVRVNEKYDRFHAFFSAQQWKGSRGVPCTRLNQDDRSRLDYTFAIESK